jgi:hypothetical protein
MKRYVFLSIASYVIMSGAAFAQGLSLKSAELSLSVGDTSFSNKPFTVGQPQSAIPIKGSMNLSSGKMGEARINFYNSKRLGAEFLYGYQYGGVTFNRTTAPASRFGVPLQVHTLTVNFLYYPFSQLNSPWRPFVFFGGGATIYRPSSGGQKAAKDPLQGNFDTFFETSRATGIVGVGVKRPVTKSIGFRADAGVDLTKVPTFGLPESSAQVSATVLPVGGTVRAFRASAGVIFNLGR